MRQIDKGVFRTLWNIYDQFFAKKCIIDVWASSKYGLTAVAVRSTWQCESFIW